MNNVREFTPRNGDRPAPVPLPEPAPVTDIATLSLTLRSDGSIHIQGPIQNKMLCYGLMESAKMTIAAQPTSPIVTL